MRDYRQRALAVVIIAAFGLGLSLAIERVHRQLDSDLSYASFCNVNSSVNCDVVLTSSYAELGGVSVSILAVLYYCGLLIAAIVTMRATSASRRETVANAIFIVACAGFALSFYLAFIAVAVLRTICLLCTGLYVIAVGMLVAAWLLRSSTQRQAQKDSAVRLKRERWAWVGSGIALALVATTVVWEAFGEREALNAAQIQTRRPDFYRYFFAQPLVDVPADAGHVRGGADAPVTIVAFSDFGCGHCAAFDRRIGDLLRGDRRVRLMFRHFPLDSQCNPAIQGSGTGERCMAASAAECAAQQEKFWQYARLLFEHQPNFSAADLRRYADEVGIDATKFSACLESGEGRARVEGDVKAAATLGVRSTPTLFINGRRFQGDPGENLTDAIVLANKQP